MEFLREIGAEAFLAANGINIVVLSRRDFRPASDRNLTDPLRKESADRIYAEARKGELKLDENSNMAFWTSFRE